MAFVFVDSSVVGGAGDGTTFDDAWTTWDAALNDTAVTVAGSIVYCDDGHLEANATATFNNAGTPAAPIQMISVDKTSASDTSTNIGSADAPYSPGASVNTVGIADLSFLGVVHTWGIDVLCGDNLTLGDSCGWEFNKCKFGITGASSSDALAALADDIYVKFKEVEFVFGNAAHGWNLGGGGRMVIEDCFASATGTASNNFFRFMNSRGFQVEINGLDLTNLATNGDLIGANALPTGTFDGQGCSFTGSHLRLPTGGSVNASTFADSGSYIRFTSVAIGDEAFGSYDENIAGTVVENVANYRSATYDGTNGYSAQMTSSANTVKGYRPLALHLCNLRAAANPTLTVELIHEGVGSGTAGDLQDDEFWVEIVAPKVSDGAVAVRTSSRMAIQGTPADLTNSSETWTETLTGEVKQLVTQTLSGGQAGEHEVWVYLAAPSVTVYVDWEVDGGV